MLQNVPNTPQRLLNKYFGYSSFRKGQSEIISSILEQKDTLGIMPTGGGKSACYQIPALLFPGVTLVVSPLISLMKDQVDALDSLGISSTYINSSLGARELEQRLAAAVQGKYKLIYIAPERLESERFRNLLQNIPVSLLAIDEAHCVSQWGHDFRTSYLAITPLINELPHRPIVAAFTATATVEVKQDIINLLTLQNPDVYVTGFDRANLFFSVVKGVTKTDFITNYIDDHRDKTGIIYAATRKEVESLYDYLRRKGYRVGKYHAGLSDAERTRFQDQFLFDEILIMVATNAFGMGIDKSNVRYVIHHNMPKNIEAYYQEAGRAGRDGEPSECLLLYGAQDIHIQKFLIENTLLSPERKTNEYKKLQGMVDYCHTPRCLRRYILEYFGEKSLPETCGNCDNCRAEMEIKDITVEAQKIFSCVKRMGERFGINMVAGVLKGSKNQRVLGYGFDKLSTYGIMKEYPLREIINLINLLIAEEYLKLTESKFPIVQLRKKVIPVLRNEEAVTQRVPRRKQAIDADASLFGVLRALRKEIAEREKVPPYIIFHDSTLREMCHSRPEDARSMLAIPGVGETKFKKYGEQFLEAIRKYRNEQHPDA